MHAGYIGITDLNWYKFNKSKNHAEVVFWRRASKPVNLPKGMPFFFFVKGTNPRYIRGYGFVKLIGSENVKDLWDEYGNEMGADSLSSVEFVLKKERDDLIGYYVLENVKFLDSGIDLNDLDIEFASSIVSGKRIDDEDTKKLLSAFGDESKYKPILIEHFVQRKKYNSKRSDGRSVMLEANFESILVERLDDLEDGLVLIKRQYSIPPVGRVDLFCKDKENNLVVIELKKYGAKDYSIIDQISRYMGYIKKHVAENNQKVRGIIVVGKINDKLNYAASIIPNLEVKSFKISIS